MERSDGIFRSLNDCFVQCSILNSTTLAHNILLAIRELYFIKYNTNSILSCKDSLLLKIRDDYCIRHLGWDKGTNLKSFLDSYIRNIDDDDVPANADNNKIRKRKITCKSGPEHTRKCLVDDLQKHLTMLRVVYNNVLLIEPIRLSWDKLKKDRIYNSQIEPEYLEEVQKIIENFQTGIHNAFI